MSNNNDQSIKFFSNEHIPLEMHKVRMVQRLELLPISKRLQRIQEAGNNTFLLKNRDVFLDMLSDSGVNAMSDRQYSAMFLADDAYAGSETFYRLESVVKDFFNKEFFLPAHQGRACENIIASSMIEPGKITIMNYHFTTTKAHITRLGGTVIEVGSTEMFNADSTCDFKGDINISELEKVISENNKEDIAFVRIEAGTNLVGGQPVSLQNMKDTAKVCRKHNIPLVFDASLLADNLYFIKTKENAYKDVSLKDIVHEISDCMDIIYFSGRKLGCARGGGIATSNAEHYNKMRELVTLFEGFLTYGGMSVREMEAMTVGLQETLDFQVINQTPLFIQALGEELELNGVPVVKPFGGLGCHLNASKFVDHIHQSEYPALALTSAIYLVGGIRGMERGTFAEQRNPDGSEHFANMELVRLAVPKRVFTLSQIKFVADRISWLYKNRHLIKGMQISEEPATLRFFLGKLEEKEPWQEKLVEKFLEDMPNGL